MIILGIEAALNAHDITNIYACMPLHATNALQEGKFEASTILIFPIKISCVFLEWEKLKCHIPIKIKGSFDIYKFYGISKGFGFEDFFSCGDRFTQRISVFRILLTDLCTLS
jgi:hypothetical protein